MNNIAIVVPVHNRREITLNFLQQLPNVAVEGINPKVVIVDDGSTDGTFDAVRKAYPDVILLRGGGNLWWTGAVRKGVEYALQNGHDPILIMNDDLELDKEFLSELFCVVDRYPDALVSSIKLERGKDGRDRVITAGFKIKGWLQQIDTLHAKELYRESIAEVLECDILTGSSMLIPAKVFHKIGMFDNKHYPHGFGDFEFTRRASLAGFRCLVATKSRVYTERNQNYAWPYLAKSTRRDFLRNLFNKTKFGYGFASLRQYAYMHRPFLLGTIIYGRRLLGLSKMILMKVFLPDKILRRLVHKKLSES